MEVLEDNNEDSVSETSSIERDSSVISTIKIFARIRPPNKAPKQKKYSIEKNESIESIKFFIPKIEAHGLINNQKDNFQFKFDHIFDVDTKQE